MSTSKDPTSPTYAALWTLGVILSAVAYGIVIALTVGCCYALHQTSPKMSTTSRSMRRFLYSYISIMVLLATTSLVSAIGGVMRCILNPSILLNPTTVADLYVWGIPFSGLECICTVVAAWCTDAFMIWRCVILYQGLSRPMLILFTLFITTLALTDLAFGLVVMASLSLRFPLNPWATTTWFFYVQAAANSVTTLLIILRISYHQRHMRRVFGQNYGTLYTKIMTMCVESSALIVLCIIVANAMGNTDGDFIPVKLTVQIEVTATFLIIYRVAQGKAWSNNQTASKLLPGAESGEIKSIKFAPITTITTTSSRMGIPV